MADDPRAFKPLVMAAREYFDLDTQLWTGRKALVDALEAHADRGEHVLRDPAAIRWFVYQGRSFKPDLRTRKGLAAAGLERLAGLAGGLDGFEGGKDHVHAVFSMPESHGPHRRLAREFPRRPPLPIIVRIHELEDAEAEVDPGQAVIERDYSDRAEWADFRKRWIVLAPVRAQADWMNALAMQRVLARFWKHYHVDFDRFVLDGGGNAFDLATANAVYFAGIVLRGDWRLDASQRRLVRNIGPVPVYVVDNPALAADLRAAGHDHMTSGDGGAALRDWLEPLRRAPPLAFRWIAAGHNRVLPYWMNLDGVDWDAERRRVQVRVRGHDGAIEIGTEGIREISLFLNDEIVDLDQPIRIEVNGRVVHDVRMHLTDRMKALGRDVDILFNREPVRIRSSMYFGWLTPHRIVRLKVPPPSGPLDWPEPEPAAPPEVPPEPPARLPGHKDGPSWAVWLALALLAALVVVTRAFRRRT